MIRPTFITIFKRKSSDGFQSIPYVVALSSAMLLLYYGVLKTDASMIISINAIGIAIEVTYLTIHVIYASKAAKVSPSSSTAHAFGLNSELLTMNKNVNYVYRCYFSLFLYCVFLR